MKLLLDPRFTGLPAADKFLFKWSPHPKMRVQGLQRHLTKRSRGRGKTVRLQAASSSFLEDRILSIKISLAKSSGSLDMGWLGLDEIPSGVFELTELEVEPSWDNSTSQAVRPC